MWTVTMDDGELYYVPRNPGDRAQLGMQIANNVARYWGRTHRAVSAE